MFVGFVGLIVYMEDRTEALVQRLLRDPSFQRWAMGDAFPDSSESDSSDTNWEAWAKQSAAHRRAVHEARQTVQTMQFAAPSVDPDVVDTAWARFDSARSAATSPPAEQGSRRRRPPRRRARSTAQRTGYAWAAAALLAVMALTIFLVRGYDRTSAEQTVRTAYGERTTVAVTDDIRATLAGNSTLRYGEDAPHQLTLEGEARFEVEPRADTEAPVTVQTPDGTVRVMGTTFTVSHWDATTDVVLASGVVKVTAASEAVSSTTMAPGDWVTFDDEHGIQQQRTTNPDAYQSWTTDTIVFDDTPVEDIATRIERFYGYEVVIEEESIRSARVSGAVENELAVLIDGLQRILDRPIERTDERIIIQ